MKCQILFSRKNKKNIICLSSAESAHSMVSVNRKNLLTEGEIFPLKIAPSEKGDKYVHVGWSCYLL